jgi:hypothetical protein
MMVAALASGRKRPRPDCAPEGVLGLLRSIEIYIVNSKIEVRHRKVRVEFDRFSSFGDCLLVAASSLVDPSEAIVAIEEQRFARRIQRDFETGEEAGVHGTPTFFINGKQYEGSWEA